MARRNRRRMQTRKSNEQGNTLLALAQIERIDSRITQEKKQLGKKASPLDKPILVSFGLVTIIMLGLFVAGGLLGSTSTNIENPTSRPVPNNLPNRGDPTLTQDPKLSSAYDYAKANKGNLDHLICYCGCHNPKHQPYHQSNYECFWTEGGTYERHAENCSTCVYIALTAKALYEGGWSSQEVRMFVDAQYS